MRDAAMGVGVVWLLVVASGLALASEPGYGVLSEEEAWVFELPDSVVADVSLFPQRSMPLTSAVQATALSAEQVGFFLEAFERPRAHGFLVAPELESAGPVLEFHVFRDSLSCSVNVAPLPGWVWRGQSLYKSDLLGLRRLVVGVFPEFVDNVGPLFRRDPKQLVDIYTIDDAHEFFGLYPGTTRARALPAMTTNSGEIALDLVDGAGKRLVATSSWRGLFVAVDSGPPRRVARSSIEERAIWFLAYSQLVDSGSLSDKCTDVSESMALCENYLPEHWSLAGLDDKRNVIEFLSFIERGQRTVRQYLCDE